MWDPSARGDATARARAHVRLFLALDQVPVLLEELGNNVLERRAAALAAAPAAAPAAATAAAASSAHLHLDTLGQIL